MTPEESKMNSPGIKPGNKNGRMIKGASKNQMWK